MARLLLTSVAACGLNGLGRREQQNVWRPRTSCFMKSNHSLRFIKLISFTGLFLAFALGFIPAAQAQLPYSLGGAHDYAVLGEGGSVDMEVYQSGTNVYGNVGIGPNTPEQKKLILCAAGASSDNHFALIFGAVRGVLDTPPTGG